MTHLSYLHTPEAHTWTATYLSSQEDERGTAIILNETIFYPQGGGQPADTGYITCGTHTFLVTNVRMNKEGIVLHYGTWEKTQAPLGATATLLIDKEKRLLHTYLHAAGHLIDIALHSLGHQLPSAASYHFPDNPYVEYMGALPSDPTLMTRLQEKVFELQEAHLPVYTQIYTEEEAEKLGLHAPIGKEVRVVQYGTHAGVGCGGTHVANTSALPPIYIRKISHKRGCTKVQYIVYGKSNA